jgi:glucose/mannose-6-phosphate isomerase
VNKEDTIRHYHIDESRMLDYVRSIPDQIATGWEQSADFNAPYTGDDSALIICGMGGSSIGGHLLRDLIGESGRVPIHLENGYRLPSWACEKSSVICVSYSGNTEEVLSCFSDAIARGCTPAVVTSGGKLAEEGTKAGASVLLVPEGMPPRAAIGFLFSPLMRIATRWGLFDITDEGIDRAVRKSGKLVQRYSLEGDPGENAALQLAKHLYGKIPCIYSGNGLLEGVAYRWKCQFNENSKSMAFSNAYPELGHNEVMGWECPERFREEHFIILLRDVDDHPRIRKRMDITHDMLEPLSGGAAVIDSEGTQGREGRLIRLLSVLLLGDFTSVYLAVEYGKDPTPIEGIERIKEKLKMEEE